MPEITVRIQKIDGSTQDYELDPKMTIGRLRIKLALELRDSTSESAGGGGVATIPLPKLFGSGKEEALPDSRILNSLPVNDKEEVRVIFNFFLQRIY